MLVVVLVSTTQCVTKHFTEHHKKMYENNFFCCLSDRLKEHKTAALKSMIFWYQTLAEFEKNPAVLSLEFYVLVCFLGGI